MPILKVYKNGEWEEVGNKIITDRTLSLSDVAADSKTVGDAFTKVNSQISSKQDRIAGEEGQFVVIGADGRPTVKTVPSAEGVGF